MGINFIELILFGIPEEVMCVLIGLVMCQKRFMNGWSSFFIRLMVSISILLTLIYISRPLFNRTALHTIFITLVYVLVFKIIWQMNWRKSIVAGFSTMFILVVLETAMYPVYERFRLLFGDENFFSTRFGFSPILRLVQLLVLIILTKFNLQENKLFVIPWRQLSLAYKYITVIITAAVILCFLFNVNYIDIYVQVKIHNINTSGIMMNLQMFFWGNIVFFVFFVLLTILLFAFDQKFQRLKEMIDIPHSEMIDIIGNDSDAEEIQQYIYILQNKIAERG